VKLLLKFGFLREAKGICDNPKMMELIFNAAQEAGDRELVAEFARGKR
jgi:hypothetical protein